MKKLLLMVILVMSAAIFWMLLQLKKSDDRIAECEQALKKIYEDCDAVLKEYSMEDNDNDEIV